MAVHEPDASLGKRMEALALAPVLVIGTLGVGWLVWSVLEWGNSRTPSYRLLGLHVVRTADEQRIGWGRSFARSTLCLVLVLPTIVVCGVIGISFVFGASAPEDLLRQPRAAPWDRLTATKVVDERTQSKDDGGVAGGGATRVDLSGISSAPAAHSNGRAH